MEKTGWLAANEQNESKTFSTNQNSIAMLLPNRLPTRRKFLERSVWGFGNLLVSSSLLQSCIKDHIIPDPEDSPIVTDPAEIDWSSDAKIVLIAGLELIPYAGHILGPLIDILWKPNQDVWGQIKDQVEALINQKIDAYVYQQVSEDLKGLNNSLILYQNELHNGTPNEILTQWLITKNLFVNALPHFQSKGYEMLLLPLFGQFVGLYLSILRDAVIDGKKWGRTNADQQQDITDLKQSIQGFTSYTLQTYVTSLDNVNPGRNDHLCEPFRSVNAYARQITLTVLDFMSTWPYYDVTLYPNGAKNPDGTPLNILTREIYSDPFGTCDNSNNGDPIDIPRPVPTQRPTNLTVWGGDRINAVQLTYPPGSGPGGVTQTARMGNQNKGSNQPPGGGTINLSLNNPIIRAKATYGDIVNSLQFALNDSTVTNEFGGGYTDPNHKPNDSLFIGYPYEALSSIYIHGISYFYDCADCVVFGFQHWKSPTATLRALRLIYVLSPNERSEADFVKELPTLAIPAGLITDELKAARKAHWESIKARAKALK